MRSPALGDVNDVRTWSVNDVAIPLPFNIGGSEFSSAQFSKPGSGWIKAKSWRGIPGPMGRPRIHWWPALFQFPHSTQAKTVADDEALFSFPTNDLCDLCGNPMRF